MTEQQRKILERLSLLDRTGTVQDVLDEYDELHDSLHVPATTDPAISRQQARRHWEAFHAIAK